MSDWENGVADLSLKEDGNGQAQDHGKENGQALGDVTNTKKFTAQKIADHGWAEPTKFDYERYIKAAAPAGERAELEGQAPAEDSAQHPEWAANAARYEWKEEYGEVGPKVPELEERLFRNRFILRKGNKFENMALNVTQESSVQIRPIQQFEDAGLHPVMLENIKLCEYEMPTPIQAYCIPALLQNHDVIAVAQTGSGKTAAYLIPALSKLMGKAKKLAAHRPDPTANFDARFNGVRAEPLLLVIAPTRELAVQIFDEARRLCYRSMLRPGVVYGGGPMREQLDELARGCDILIGTPGRLIDMLSRGHVLSLRRVRYTIIDEADELVGAEWQEDLNKIMGGGDNNEDADHRYMLFSATFPKEARRLAKDYLDVDHIRFSVGRLGSTHKNIKQTIINCEEEHKRNCLIDLLMDVPPTRTIIFVNNKRAADFVDDFLFNQGLPSTSIHSDRTQREREDAIRSFKTGRAPILVTTGVSARGLDFADVMHVINYDLPSVDHGGITEYLHRIGRTARMGNTGVASSFYNERDEALGPMLTKILVECNSEIPDFLEQFKPDEGETLNFEDDSGDEEEEAGAGGDAWGGGRGDDAWGGGGGSGGDGAGADTAADSGAGDAWSAGTAAATEAPVEAEW